MKRMSLATLIGWKIPFGIFGKVRLHPLFLALAVFAVGVGLWRDLVVLFLLVMLHELGHAAMATQLGYQVEEVSLLPFGGVAKISYGNVGFRPRHEAAIAIAGPFINFALIGLSWVMWSLGFWSVDFFQRVVQLNLWIAVFNLLPGLPLDGGRVLRAARSRTLGYEGATQEAYKMALAISFGLLVLGGLALWSGYPHAGILILGLFLLVTAWTGRRDVSVETVRFLDSRRRQGYVRPQVVRALAVSGENSVREVVKQFAPDRYHMVYILDREGTVRTVLEEDEILDAVFAGRWMDKLEEWVDKP
ncbi:M50 family metallopeptidase [Alicyclobacillus tolerans]|uniref:M50 family metallopeptidase n=1 Tax=Alicyclobacillus tolerans TaxID=90970 RepID=UPI001F157605|nr:M50 family metallopeptidase [Alicyclobacillus tolerans]MCF8563559.1 M50 family metallopeptidase [Alicyclobacillus tolerans]